jgi:hypothetical protein
MPRFEQVRQEVMTDSHLKEAYEKFIERIKAGEYPSNELTEDKIIDLCVDLIIERKEGSPHIHRSAVKAEWMRLYELEVEFYFKVLWVVLSEKIGITTLGCLFEYLNAQEQNGLKERLLESYTNTITQDSYDND